MTGTQRSLPKWILIVSAVFALLEIGVSLALWFSPESIADEVDLTARGAHYLISIWATRQFALGVIFGFATIKRSIPMLTIAYLFLLVMFIGDLLIGISQKENSLILTALVMCLIAAAMLWVLNKRRES
jgi:hypothetical protein